MKVAFHLRRRPEPAPAAAVLLETDRAEAVLGLLAGPGPAGLIHRVAGGFLVEVGDGARPPLGAIRLRRLAEGLYLPVDADLVPSLLDDEAEGLARGRGLVFLPGGRVLGFDPGRPVALAELVVAGRRPGGPWRPFPGRPARAERIAEITRERPEGPTEDLFEAGGDPAGIGPEATPRPGGAGAAATLADRAAAGAGRGLIGLGGLLGLKSLAGLGARWIGRAAGRVPRPTAAVLGRQEAALRELLRQFREGQVDRALRHALPLGGDGGRGSAPAITPELPAVDPTYSLRSLLGAGRGADATWSGGSGVRAELAREYRKAAEEAERRGDFRRAAYIHGRLLDDFATAAHLLARAGLHRDAAIIHLDRLDDIPAAARAFEAAGEVDRALQLYRRARMHAEAGDLLRRLGEAEAAGEAYLLAAEALAGGRRPDRLAAGDLLRDRAGRPDLASDHYAAGWAARPAANAIPCALRIAASFADLGDSRAILGLADEADDLFGRPGQDSAAASGFYDGLARLADRRELAGARDDLRDRALMGLAAGLRREVAADGRPAALASTYLGRSRLWPADVVGDAAHALRAAAGPEADRRRDRPAAEGPGLGSGSGARRAATAARRIEVFAGTVTAACHARVTGEVFLGSATGEVFRVDAARGEVGRVADGLPPVASMAVDAEGRTLAVLAEPAEGRAVLARCSRAPGPAGWDIQRRMVDLPAPGPPWLTPMMAAGASRTVGVWDGEELVLMSGVDGLTPVRRVPLPFLKAEPEAALLLESGPGHPRPGWSVLIHDGTDLCRVDAADKLLHRRDLGWRPRLPAGSTLRAVPLSWLQVEPGRVELAGLDGEGVVHWSSLKIDDAELIRTSNNLAGGNPPYVAATLARAGLVAGVRPSGVDWLRCGPRSFTKVGSTAVPLASALAGFPSHRTGELILACGDGSMACVPIPR